MKYRGGGIWISLQMQGHCHQTLESLKDKEFILLSVKLWIILGTANRYLWVKVRILGVVNVDKPKILRIKLKTLKSFNPGERVLDSNMPEFHVREALWTHWDLLRLFLSSIILRQKDESRFARMHCPHAESF